MIITLAGHVDHGKTSLVRQLTGIDTDRLAEEKRRGLTIDLGFAYAEMAGQRLGFVDVPGHHRFIHNMIAGVASNQYAMVVVAADDGPMPQTYEHLTILAHAGVTRGVIAITKTDRVDAERIDAVRDVSLASAAAAGLEIDAVLPVSSATGVGVDALRAQLIAAANAYHASASTGCFRLAVDRVFIVRGSGLVVTGTVHSGTLTQGTELTIAPRGLRTRVRNLRVSDRPADTASAGDRCAVNITGVEVGEIERGDWLVETDSYAPTRNVVIELTVTGDLPRPVRHWLPVHAYLATSHAEGHVALLESTALGRGEHALVELVLDEPLHAKHGDRIVLRDHGLERTVGGGRVIDIAAPTRTRRDPARLAQLRAQTHADSRSALNALLAIGDVDIDLFRRSRNLTRIELDALLTTADPIRLVRDGREFAIEREGWQRTLTTLRTRIAAYHNAAPHSAGIKSDQLRRLKAIPDRWLDTALAALVEAGQIHDAGGHFHVPGHRPRLPPEDAALLERIEALLDDEAQPPSSGDIAKRLGIALRAIDTFIKRMAGLGLLVRVGSNRVLRPEQLDRFATTAQRLANEHRDGFSARQFRDAAGVGRNLAIDVLEHFDRCGYTRRYGDVRRIVGAASVLRRAS